MNRGRIARMARELEVSAVNAQQGEPVEVMCRVLLDQCAAFVEQVFPLGIGRLELSMQLNARQWKRLEKMNFDTVKKALPMVHSLEWDGHFGRAIYFRIDNDKVLALTLAAAMDVRKRILGLLGT